MSDWTGPKFEPQNSRSKDERVTTGLILVIFVGIQTINVVIIIISCPTKTLAIKRLLGLLLSDLDQTRIVPIGILDRCIHCLLIIALAVTGSAVSLFGEKI